MPTSETFRWAGWRHEGAGSEPEPVAVRCARCAFVAEGELAQARVESICRTLPIIAAARRRGTQFV